ncbi:tetratricopeptide repeat protein [Candidatus Magnetominusculus xianensis]|uniref:PEP-CTERM system TPR-repeat lipoprotein n=1 Tax=Candidatus Magnetominusculus xianensis TaxID=1748249 RepID=A0ABR5SHP0_9BACT|nr:hypothetical protein [Candidatus Magnetominusculus xianensis]KWT87803.1 putative PEP-CTERM system TPR-repeat lipoprotein [Candidatus Magnetominusculus xianensis]MBF0405482.1 hypothetical protein [Nitrospirota bacterium]
MTINRIKTLSPDAVIRVYTAAFLLYVVFALSSQPIVNGDTDLWYHLNGGRFITAHGEIPDASFFSFLTPPRHWVNYYWLFQLLCYKIYDTLGSAGLIALRSLLFILITVTLWGLFRARLGGVTPLFVLLFTIYIMLLLPRCLLSRPHVFSYLFITVFVYIYEIRPGRSYILGVIALLWVNLHGVEYPVMLLISGAYMAEVYVRRLRRKTPFTKEELIILVSSAACIVVVYLTPHGATLINVPFIDTRYASVYINELRAGELLGFNLSDKGISYASIFNVTAVLTLICIITALRNKKLRLSHIVMLLGAIVILTKGARFRTEFALLVVPVIVNGLPLNNAKSGTSGFPAALRYIAVAALLSLPFIHNTIKESPVRTRELPHGVVSFLKHVKHMPDNGTLMNHPNSGGYLQWELYPRYKIAMDMEVPFLFSDFDFYNLHMSYQDEVVFRKFTERYRPSYITVPIQFATFKGIISKFPEYKPVFFDDTEVLYTRQPDVIKLYAIQTINPFAPEIPAVNNSAAVNAELAELNKIASIDPHIDSVNRLIAQIKINLANYDEAAQFADRIISSSPDLSTGYYLKGDALIGKKSYSDALKYFITALGYAPDAPLIYRKLSECRSKMRQDKEAYQALSKAVDIFSPQTPYSDLYMLGLLALSDGDIERAQMLFMSAYEKLPPLVDNASVSEWEMKIKKMLSAY